MQFIDLKTQYQHIKTDVLARIEKVLDHGYYINGPEVNECEKQLAEFVGVKHAIGVSSGTDALIVALLALDIKPGEEVITSAFSFFATAEVMQLLGIKPVFVDIDPDTYNIDSSLIEAAITSKTKAIMPVSLYGQCPDMDAINAIALKHGLPVIEDGAQSFGATYNNKRSCGLSTIGCTSFFPAKPLGAYGDAGACFTNDDTLAEKMREVKNHGQNGRYHHVSIGLNARLDTLQAAILMSKLSIFDQELAARLTIAKRYDDLLKDVAKISVIKPGQQSAYAQYTLLIENREAAIESLTQQGIPTSVHYPCGVHEQPAFINAYGKQSFPHTEYAGKHVLSLPMHPYLDEATQDKIINAVKVALDISKAA